MSHFICFFHIHFSIFSNFIFELQEMTYISSDDYMICRDYIGAILVIEKIEESCEYLLDLNITFDIVVIKVR